MNKPNPIPGHQVMPEPLLFALPPAICGCPLFFAHPPMPPHEGDASNLTSVSRSEPGSNTPFVNRLTPEQIEYFNLGWLDDVFKTGSTVAAP
jgi:hypothetical protein